jgi:hypothetical protein
VIDKYPSSTRKKAIAGGLTLLAFACASAQAPQAGVPSKGIHNKVPLVANTCPEVRVGDVIALDWNPSFAPAGPVTGLRSVRLTFGRVTSDGFTTKSRVFFSAGSKAQPVATSTGANGSFHVEFSVPQMPEGTYRAVDAQAIPMVQPAYIGDFPQMAASPADQQFCITVVSSSGG